MNFEIIAPRVEFLDPRTGRISREWYRFFQTLFNRAGGATGTNLEDLIVQFDQSGRVAELQARVDELEKRVLALEINQ